MLFKFHKVSVYNKIPLSYDFVLVIADSLRIEPFPGLTVLSSLAISDFTLHFCIILICFTVE